jgi:hypothetical protein
MSTTKIVIIVGMCLFVGGCVPVTGIKSIAALTLSLIAIVGAWFGLAQQNHEHNVCQKARDLDKEVTNHKAKYHPSDAGI